MVAEREARCQFGIQTKSNCCRNYFVFGSASLEQILNGFHVFDQLWMFAFKFRLGLKCIEPFSDMVICGSLGARIQLPLGLIQEFLDIRKGFWLNICNRHGRLSSLALLL